MYNLSDATDISLHTDHTGSEMVGPKTLTIEIEGREILTTEVNSFHQAYVFTNRLKAVLKLGPDTDYQIYITCH